MSIHNQEGQFQTINNLELDQGLSEEIEASKLLLPNTIPKQVVDQFLEIIESHQFMQVSANDVLNIKLESEDIISLYVELFILKKYLTKYNLEEYEDHDMNILNAQILIPKLIHLIKTNEIPLIQYDVLWILGNIATFQAFDKLIIQNDGIDIILQYLNSTYQQIQLQANWTLGNIATEGELQQVCRDQVRQKGGVESILRLLSKLKDPKTIEQCIWSLTNICSDGITHLKEETVKEIILQLCNFINNYDDEIIIQTCLVFLCEIIPSTYEKSLYIVQSNIVPKLLRLVVNQKRKISIKSFEFLYDLFESGGQVCDHILSLKFLDVAETLLKDKNSRIKKMDVLTCCLLLCKGTEKQQKLLIENQMVFQEIFKQVQLKNTNFIQSFVNLTLSKDRDIILVLINNQIISNFTILFEQLQDNELLEKMLKGLENIFSVVKTEIVELNPKQLINNSELNQIKELFYFHKVTSLRVSAEHIIQLLE
ncbi:unnamed protein product (macronuclear) [Paramecium tetraurelia]|uniref:Armadillo repeat-containing domain-containing protein n=1 Tax=Paramecium tetraurelia TaxID=5888 RepID=A0BJZ9_PARTE|nr:uncharacterized protein GSPATT00029496001 [Paramecium tetraurelia]CAK58866.1 unnamed protein product [Paramecium tetraurelia]|eukprot:XP_001426264.1 hypothetical protein (macronuclear) [Paramecium tetraurelia strain d4-2]